ncbi:hypothetical protein QBE54_08200 [Thermatribacter velox]|uniref:Transposase IS111A/IS1328/IS1533 N-terminal domain-containing protein n=1 Tax=Thermatribacter velox TaxID=3039681 RepID=A0ABZ2Y9B3_9BACT
MTHSLELLAWGIDPGRYAIQLALRSPSQVYCNLSLPISAKGIATFRELVPSSAEVVVEGFGTTGRLFFLELAQEGYSFFELNPRLGKHLRFLVREGRISSTLPKAVMPKISTQHPRLRQPPPTSKSGVFSFAKKN